MKIVVFTSNALRHKFVANTLSQHADEALIIVECKKSDAPLSGNTEMSQTEEHFAKRYLAEVEYFKNNKIFIAPTLPLEYKEVNSTLVYEMVKEFSPDMGFVFGSSIIRDPLLSLIPQGKFVNMHLGLSPYYRGSGTNFWPFINEELEYVGATLLHIDAGIDTGDIIAHARPKIELGDTVHTIGCKTIIAGTNAMVECLEKVKRGTDLQRVKQWKVPVEKYYTNKDFTEDILKEYLRKLDSGLIEKHLNKKAPSLKLVRM